jgi:thiamine kinase
MAERIPNVDAAGMSAEQALARALVHVPGCEDGAPALAVRALSGGSINRSLRVDTARGSFVVRLGGLEAVQLGADRRREARLHGLAAAAGLAPRILFAAPDASFLVTEWLTGRVFARADMQHRVQLRKIAGRLAELHALRPPANGPHDGLAGERGALDPLAQAQRFAAQIGAQAPLESRDIAALLTQARGATDRAGSAGRARTIVHNDLHHANLLEADRVYLLDWEYANLGDPLLDLASLLAYHPAARLHEGLLLQETGLIEVASPENLRALTWLFDLLNFLWYRARRLQHTPTPAERAAEHAARRRLAAP